MSQKTETYRRLVPAFLEKTGGDKSPVKVLQSNTYRIGKSNVLVRAAAQGGTGRYFFGVNYLTIEELSNLDNTFIAFVCGSLDRTVIIPANELFVHLGEISRDRNGEYKIVLDRDLNVILKGRGNRMDCHGFINQWGFFDNPPDSACVKPDGADSSVEESMHAVMQGRLLRIGNVRGYSTFCPDKRKTFNREKLEKISALKKCPELQFSEYSLLRQIDVIWFKDDGRHHVPAYAFEVELSTGMWPGVGRMSTLLKYSDVSLYVIGNDANLYKKVIDTQANQERYKYLSTDLVSELYSAEMNLAEIRRDIGL